MKNGLIVGIVVISLLGLVFVQYHYLRAGLLLERTRLDQRMTHLLDEAYKKLVRPNVVSEMATRVITSKEVPLASPEYLLPDLLKDSIHVLIREYLGADSLRMDYAFALTDEKQENLFLSTNNYSKEGGKQLSYERPIGGLPRQACDCLLYFRLDIKNTVNYLLGRLAYLIVPSIIFIFLLALSLLLLVFYLNRQRKLDQFKNDFINNLTHELKTPVFSIGMLSRMLKTALEKGQNTKVEEYANLIERENKVIQGHVERVLELASLEGRNYKMEKQKLHFHPLLHEIAAAFKPQLLTQGGSLLLDLKATTDTVEIDPVHMRNVIQNLLDNALKYHRNSPEIELRTRNENEQLFIEVLDNGIGIAPDQQQRIFEKFYRVPAGNIHQVKGFGLGLNYVQQVVKAHHGQIKLFSRVEEGSRFQISLLISDK